MYIKDENDVTNPPTNIVNGYRIGAKNNDKLYLNVVVDGNSVIYTAPILMPVLSGDGPSSEKKFTVARTSSGNTIASKELTLTANHNFLDGESVRVFADDGRTPDGIEIGRKYFVITTATANKIKLANTQNDALAGIVVPKEINTKGGVLTVKSTVTDKIPGEIGHPIQFDTTENQWYVLSSSTKTTNKISEGFVGFGTEINDRNSSTYVQRRAESRALDDRIYRLRYVIPKDFKGADIAKNPEKNYVLQESKSILEQQIPASGIPVDQPVIYNRNPRVIAGVSTDASDGLKNVVVTETAHKLSTGDGVKIKNVRSSTNTTGVDNSGYNGLFTVTSTPTSKSFTYTNTNIGGAFVGVVTDARASTNGLSPANLPTSAPALPPTA